MLEKMFVIKNNSITSFFVLANADCYSPLNKIYQTHTPCGFRLVGTAFSSWRGLPIILRDDPGF